MESDREALLDVLLRHGVAFVVIGGAAIQSHGRIYDTLDIDVVPDTEQDNLARLAVALERARLSAGHRSRRLCELREVTDRLFTPRSLRGAMAWNLATRYGQLDVTFAPTGFPRGYSDLARGARLQPVAGTATSVLVASLNDAHESKRQANRPKTARISRASTRRWSAATPPCVGPVRGPGELMAGRDRSAASSARSHSTAHC
jgi:hypothetical protein